MAKKDTVKKTTARETVGSKVKKVLKNNAKPLIKTITHQTMNNTVTVKGSDLLAVLEANGLIFDKTGNVKVSTVNKSYSYQPTSSLSINANKSYKISCIKKTKTEDESRAIDIEEDDQENSSEPILFELE